MHSKNQTLKAYNLIIAPKYDEKFNNLEKRDKETIIKILSSLDVKNFYSRTLAHKEGPLKDLSLLNRISPCESRYLYGVMHERGIRVDIMKRNNTLILEGIKFYPKHYIKNHNVNTTINLIIAFPKLIYRYVLAPLSTIAYYLKQ